MRMKHTPSTNEAAAVTIRSLQHRLPVCQTNFAEDYLTKIRTQGRFWSVMLEGSRELSAESRSIDYRHASAP